MPDENSSFIPKSGVKTVKRSSGTKKIYLLAYISYIFFFSTLFAVIGVYIYGAAVDRSLNNLKEQMVAERQRFAVADIENVKQLNHRLSIAQRLLDESTAPSRLMPDIEAIVSADVRFASLKYEQLPNRQFKLELGGEADDFNQIIAQQRMLQSSGLLSEADVVSYDYSVGGEGSSGATSNAVLSFVLSDTRDLSTISYIPAAAPTATLYNVVLDDSVTAAGEETLEATDGVEGSADNSDDFTGLDN